MSGGSTSLAAISRLELIKYNFFFFFFPSLCPPIAVNCLEVRDRFLSSSFLYYRLLLTTSNRLLLSASSGRLLLSASSGHPLDRLDLDTYVPLHRVRESGLNLMSFTSLPGQGSTF